MSDLKIFTDNIEPEAFNQIYTLIKQPAFADCKVRIMPDVHAGKGCVIGFTADLGDKVIPNIVGADIGCGMLCCEIGKMDVDYEKLDSVIRKHIPFRRRPNRPFFHTIRSPESRMSALRFHTTLSAHCQFRLQKQQAEKAAKSG